MPAKWTKAKTALEDQLVDLHERLDQEEVGTEEHDRLMTALERLYKIKKDQTLDRVDANTKAVIIGNLAGIALIMSHERMHVISTKALGFVLKAKA